MSERRWWWAWVGCCAVAGLALTVAIPLAHGWRDRHAVARVNVEALTTALADAGTRAITERQAAAARVSELTVRVRVIEEERDLARALAIACGRASR
jgi:hypothetical protein